MALSNSLLKQQKFAFGKIKEMTKSETKAKYKSFIENFGLMVYNNGLINALTVAKAKKGEQPVYIHMMEWLKKENFQMGFEYGTDDLLTKLLSDEVNTQRLLVLTQEVLSLSDTLKAFAKAEL